MKKLPISFVQDLKNREFYVLISSIVQLLLETEVESSTLAKATRKLQNRESKLLLLKETKPKHYLTPKISERVTNRTEYLACLRLKIEAALLSPIPEERVAGKRLKLWIDPYKSYLFRPSIGVQGQLVEYLQYDRHKSEDVQRYTHLLNLDHIMDTLTETTRQIKALVKARIKDITHRSVNGKEVREEAYKDLQLILSVMQSIYNLTDSDEEKEQVTKLNDVINHILTEYRRELRSRITKNKNRSKKEKQIDEGLVDNEQSDQVDALIEKSEVNNPDGTKVNSLNAIASASEVDKKVLSASTDHSSTNSHSSHKHTPSTSSSNENWARNGNAELLDDSGEKVLT